MHRGGDTGGHEATKPLCAAAARTPAPQVGLPQTPRSLLCSNKSPRATAGHHLEVLPGQPPSPHSTLQPGYQDSSWCQVPSPRGAWKRVPSWWEGMQWEVGLVPWNPSPLLPQEGPRPVPQGWGPASRGPGPAPGRLRLWLCSWQLPDLPFRTGSCFAGAGLCLNYRHWENSD